MKFPPLDPGKPVTNKQLAEQNQRLHDCLHSVGERVDKLAQTVRDDRHAGANRDQIMAVDIAQIKGALGVNPNTIKQHRTLASIKPWVASAWGFLTLLGFQGILWIYQWAAPWIWQGLVSFHRHAMGG